MKLIGYLLIAAGLTLGTIGASTAYLAELSLPDGLLVGAQLAEPAWPGAQHKAPPADEQAEAPLGEQPEPAPPQPIAAADTEVTPELLAELRAAGVEYIRVKSFSFARWEGKWLTLAGVAGLLAGAFLVRRAGRQATAADVASATTRDTPESLMEQARENLLALSQQAAGEPAGPQRAHLIMQRVGEIQRGQINPIVEAHGRLRARLGLAGYARVMDRFAAAERQINRAWSAAADGDDEEALACLGRGAESLAEARERMG